MTKHDRPRLLPLAALACGLVALPLAPAGAQGRDSIPSFPDYGSGVPFNQQGQVFGGDRGWNQSWRDDDRSGGQDMRGRMGSRMGMGGALPWYRDSDDGMRGMDGDRMRAMHDRMYGRMGQAMGGPGMGQMPPGTMHDFMHRRYERMGGGGQGPGMVMLLIERDRQRAQLDEARQAVREARDALQRNDQQAAQGALDRADEAARQRPARQDEALERLLREAQQAVQRGDRQAAQIALLEARLVLRGEDDVAPGRNLRTAPGNPPGAADQGGQSGSR